MVEWGWSTTSGMLSMLSSFPTESQLMHCNHSALILQYISHPNIQVVHVQCFILMSSFLCSVNCLPQAWILIGQAVRAGQDLGLHVRPSISLTVFAYSYLPRATCLVALTSASFNHLRGKGNSAKDLVGCVYPGPHARPRFGSAIGCQRLRLRRRASG